MARTYTEDDKANAVALCIEVGPTEASKRLDIPKSSIASWLTPDDQVVMAERVTAKTRAATEARARQLDAERMALALDLMDDIGRLRAQLFDPCVERKVVTLAGSKDETGSWEIVDIERDAPTFSDQKAIMTTLAIAVDKVQVLTGEATERIEHRQVPERTPEQERELDRTLSLVRDRVA